MQLGEELAGASGGVTDSARVMVGAEVVVVAGCGEHLPGGGEDGMADGDERAFLAAAGGEAPVSITEVAGLAAACGGGYLAEDTAQPRVALAGSAGVVFAGGALPCLSG